MPWPIYPFFGHSYVLFDTRMGVTGICTLCADGMAYGSMDSFSLENFNDNFPKLIMRVINFEEIVGASL